MKNYFVSTVLCIGFFAGNCYAANDKKDNGPGDESIVKACFTGGVEAFNDYIQQHLNYPECAREAAIEGQVIVSFFVLADGTIHRPKIVKGIQDKCDEVALRVIESMPKWKPAMRGGVQVASKRTVALNFNLES